MKMHNEHLLVTKMNSLNLQPLTAKLITRMGRIFEVRKSAMFARWDKMAKNFTRIGKEIAIAVKASGPDPDNNPALRRCYLKGSPAPALPK